MIRNSFPALLLALSGIGACAQPVARMELTPPVTANRLDLPVSMDLGQLTSLPDSQFSLYETSDGKRTPVPFQVQATQHGAHRWLSWILRDDNVNGQPQKHTFELVKI